MYEKILKNFNLFFYLLMTSSCTIEYCEFKNFLLKGDIKVIAAMGDSLTAANGASSTKFLDLTMENRGLSWCIGGQWDWRNSTTLANILKVYNPKVTY